MSLFQIAVLMWLVALFVCAVLAVQALWRIERETSWPRLHAETRQDSKPAATLPSPNGL